MPLSDIVDAAKAHKSAFDHLDPEPAQNHDESTPSTPNSHLKFSELPDHRVSQLRNPPPDTPSARTGPPRSLSYTYSLPNSPASSRHNTKQTNGNVIHESGNEEDGFPFTSAPADDSEFRSALEYAEQSDKKGKRRDSRVLDDNWNPMKWFHESPKEEKSQFDFGGEPIRQTESPAPGSPSLREDTTHVPPKLSGLRRASSVPHDRSKLGLAKWGRLRSLIPSVTHHGGSSTPGPSAVTSHSVNITDELITGGLSTLMLRLWFERDEKDQRRIPILFHRLRIRVSDSLHPLHGHKSVFRIECEYANGAARWVVYRQLRDFISLHTHYAFSNAYNRNVDNLPEFPRTSMFYVSYTVLI